MKEKYLPIGTVVLLKNAKKKVMITGFCTVPNSEPNVMFDYSGCMYPEGFVSNTQTALFNHNQIEKIFYIGYESEEENEFKQKLNDVIKTVKMINPKAVQIDDGDSTIN